LGILRDDAGQFNVAGLLHARCWIHAERTIHTLRSFSEANRAAQATVRDQIWRFYQDLKAFKLTPGEEIKRTLRERFDTIFTQHTEFQTLNLALKRIHANKQEFLLVLERLAIPLHNNLSENDIRDYGKKRKISATTRSEAGWAARDTFLSLQKTCQKLGLFFWHYLQDRRARTNHLPPLPTLIRSAPLIILRFGAIMKKAPNAATSPISSVVVRSSIPPFLDRGRKKSRLFST
jgi:hypothetical protein